MSSRAGEFRISIDFKAGRPRDPWERRGPPRISIEDARQVIGEDAIYYATKLRGASNAKATATFGFAPRRLEWLGA